MKSIQEQALNQITIAGKLLDVSINAGKLSDGREYERATATVRVSHTYFGREETSEIPVDMFAAQYTSSGKLNPAYTNLQTLKKLKTAQDYGIEEASSVLFRKAEIHENNFVNRAGQLVNGWRIRASFVNENPKQETATFNNEIFIMDMRDEEDRDGNATGNLIIKGGIVCYGGKLEVLEFVAEQPEVVEYMSRNYEPNQTVNVVGRIRVTSVEEKKPASESSWGEDIPDTTTTYVRKLVLTKGDDEPKDEEFSYDPAEIKKAFNVRKATIEQQQEDARNKTKSTPAATTQKESKYSWE